MLDNISLMLNLLILHLEQRRKLLAKVLLLRLKKTAQVHLQRITSPLLQQVDTAVEDTVDMQLCVIDIR